ncbi:MAG TPA: diguanylate phosphodiesterase, partial [Azospirillum sp.]
MTVLIHIVYALAYTIAGVSVGVALPYIRPEMDPPLGWLIGTVIVLAGGLLHEVVTRLDRERTASRRFTRLREAVEGMHGELARLQAEVGHANAALEEARRAGTVVGYDTVMQEVRLLQSLVNRLHETRA